jgi:putative acetyltransferase
MIKLLSTDSAHPDFINLVIKLDAGLAEIDGEDHLFYAQLNKMPGICPAIVAFENGKPVGCGAIRKFAPGVMEVKRMYTEPAYRGKGIATQILAELENRAKELNCHACVLETGKRQPEAISLYKKNGYTQIPNYGQYTSMENSVCFEKKLV